MATLAPGSHIYVIKDVLWTNNYQDTPYFPSREAQYNWMTSHALGGIEGTSAITGVPYTHIGDHALTIRVGTNYRTARAWTYLGIHDARTDDSEPPTYNDKMWYYFINKVNYINNNVVELELELDVMQTFMFDYRLPSAFMARMHVTSDYIGGNIVPENLEMGELLVDTCITNTNVPTGAIYPTHPNMKQGETFKTPNLMFVLASTEDFQYLDFDQSHPATSTTINGIRTGMAIYAVDPNATVGNLPAWDFIIDRLSKHGKYDAIQAVWLYPRDLLTLDGYGLTGLYRVIGVKTDVRMESAPRPSQFRSVGHTDTYIPKNNKLLTYPFTFVRVSNFNGTSADFRYEFSQNPTPEGQQPQVAFTVLGDFSPSGKTKCIPYKYKNYDSSSRGNWYHNLNDFGNAIEGGEFPQIAFAGDNYKMWLASTRNAREAQLLSTSVGGVSNAISSALQGNIGGIVSAGVNTALEINAQMAQVEDHKTETASQRGQMMSYVNFMLTEGGYGFRVDTMQITPFYARAIDRYFSRYGYAINGERQVYRKQREHWTYLKTIGASIKPLDFNAGAWTRPCAMGNEDMQKINSIYDNGITFWVEPDRIGDYYGYQWDNKTLSADDIKW